MPPRFVPFGVNMLGPVLIKYGNEQQKNYWLPRILNGEDWWCQGYSEPGAGSDLASVKTTAVRDGDHYIVNGQKTWTTLGQHANMIFCLVRTNNATPRPKQGISFLLVDMNTPGVEVRPIITLDGEHEVNEVFFTDVKVPVENLVGEENKGWDLRQVPADLRAHQHRRRGLLGGWPGPASRAWPPARDEERQAAGSRTRCFAARLAKVEIDLENMKTTNLRVIAAVAGGGVPGAESSMLKIKGTEIRQEILSLIRRAMGPYAAPFEEAPCTARNTEPTVGPEEAYSAAAAYFNYRKLSIFGGSNEIQKNIISKMILGL